MEKNAKKTVKKNILPLEFTKIGKKIRVLGF